MVLYLTFLIGSVFLVSVLNGFFPVEGYSTLAMVLYTWINAILIFGIDALVATVIHKMPMKWFDPHKKIFMNFKWERKFFRAIKINAWKDYIPELGKLTTGFAKSNVDNTTPEYLYKFLVEMCYAESIHIWMSLVGIINIFANPKDLFLPIMLPLAIINWILNVPPILIQRNNRPKLLTVYEIQIKKQQKM